MNIHDNKKRVLDVQTIKESNLTPNIKDLLIQIQAGKKVIPLTADIMSKNILSPDLHPDRFDFLIQHIMNDQTLITDKSATNEVPLESFISKKLITDIPAWMMDSRLANAEMQVVAQEFIFNRVELLSSRMLMLQYSIEKRKKAVELLECFKNFLDVTNCVFILAIDYDVIVNGAKKFGDEKGQAFFDKMIKLPFILPFEHYNLKEYLKNNMEKMFDKKDVEQKYFTSEETTNLYLRIIENSIGNNPRSIGRTLNSFYIMYNMDNISYNNKELNARKEICYDDYEIKITDLFFFFCCVRSVYLDLFNYLLNDIEKISGKDKKNVENYINDLQKDIDLHLSKINVIDIVERSSDKDFKNKKELFKIYCNILIKLNRLESLSTNTIYEVIVRARTTDGRLNKL